MNIRSISAALAVFLAIAVVLMFVFDGRDRVVEPVPGSAEPRLPEPEHEPELRADLVESSPERKDAAIPEIEVVVVDAVSGDRLPAVRLESASGVTTTDENGFAVLPAERVPFRAAKDGYASRSVSMADLRESSEVALAPAGRALVVRVGVRGGRPSADQLVYVGTRPIDPLLAMRWSNDHAWPDFVQAARTGPNGEASFFLDAGIEDYWVNVDCRAGFFVRGGPRGLKVPSDASSVDLEIDQLYAIAARLQCEAITANGRFANFAPLPLGSEVVAALKADNAVQTAIVGFSRDGRTPPTANWSVFTRDFGWQDLRVQGVPYMVGMQVTATPCLVQNLVLGEVEVIDEWGVLAGDAGYMLVSPGPLTDPHRIHVPLSSGRWRLPPGRYRVEARFRPERELLPTSSLEVRAGETTTFVVPKPQNAARVLLRLPGAGPDSAGVASVSVLSLDGAESGARKVVRQLENVREEVSFVLPFGTYRAEIEDPSLESALRSTNFEVVSSDPLSFDLDAVRPR
jgi:hypothetical protein